MTSRRTAAAWATAAAPRPAHIDVLIPTVHRPAELAVTLAGLAAQDDPPFRVIISDQSEGAPSWEAPAAQAMIRVLEAQGREVQLHRHLPRRGVGEQRAFLLTLATAPRALFLDDDAWLEPGALETLSTALDSLGCGFVGMAVQGLSYLSDDRPNDRESFLAWAGPVVPERIRRDSPAIARASLHAAANLVHVARDLGMSPGEWRPYHIAWIGGCVLYDRSALDAVGGFDFWHLLPEEHSGEDVAAEWRVMERFGGAGIVPSAAVHLEAPTTVPNRETDAPDVVFDAQSPRR